MPARHLGEFLDGVTVAIEGHVDLQMRDDFRQIGFFHRKLEFAVRLENLVALGRGADLDLDVEQAVAHFYVRVVRLRREEISFGRHLARLLQHCAGVPHFLLDELVDLLAEHAEFGTRHDLRGISRGGGGVLAHHG